MITLMTLDEVAEWLRLTAQTIKKLCREGEIPCAKIGKSYRFDREELTAWIRNRK